MSWGVGKGLGEGRRKVPEVGDTRAARRTEKGRETCGKQDGLDSTTPVLGYSQVLPKVVREAEHCPFPYWEVTDSTNSQRCRRGGGPHS